MDSIAGKISESPARKSRIHIQLEETCSNGNKYVELSDMSRAYSAAISPIHPLFLRQNLHRTWLIPSQATFMDGSPLGVSASAQKIAAGRPFMAS